MSTSKATRYSTSLQASLHDGRYHEVPELSRKVRKHDIDRTTFARSAEVQAALLVRLERSQREIDDANFNDHGRQLHWLELSAEETAAEKGLLDEAYSLVQKASSEDKEYFDVTNLFYGISIRQLSASIDLSSTMNILPSSPNHAQFMALRGIISELTQDQINATRQYRSSCQGAATNQTPVRSVWRSHALYRLAVLSPSASNYEAYMKYHTSFRENPSARHLHVLELYPESEQYREHLLHSSQFPSAKSTNVKLLDYVSSVVEPWIVAGADPATAEDILKLLREAALKTFHSPRILRYIFRALSALERFDEAALSLDAYLQIAYHASKTQPGSDVDSASHIVDTIHYAVCHTFRKAPVSWQGHLRASALVVRLDKIMATIQSQDDKIRSSAAECRGVQLLLTYEATGRPESLKAAVRDLRTVSEQSPSNQLFLELAAAHIYDNDLPASMSSIHAALQLESQNMTSLLVFANLLCCEELYDRALAVLSSVLAHTGLSSTTWDHKINLLRAKIMEIKVREIVDGSSVALNHAAGAFSLYSTYFGASMSAERQVNPEQGAQHENQSRMTNGTTHNVPVFQTNGNGVNSMEQSLDHRQRPQTASTGQTDSLMANRRPPGEPHTIRSASVKLSHPRLHVPHMHLRKAASLRSRSRSRSSLRTPQGDSSRSSSPINHPSQFLSTAPVQSIVVSDSVHSDVIPDKQKTALDIQKTQAAELLVDMWLYVAKLSESSGASTAYLEAQQALSEAQAVSGQTPRVLVAQLELRTRQLESRGILDLEELDAIEEVYEAALNLDISNVDTILSLANFLLRDTALRREGEPGSRLDADRLARAYELIESIKSSPAALYPDLWRCSADIAVLRGEHERAENEYWRAVELSDMQGVVKWSELF